MLTLQNQSVTGRRKQLEKLTLDDIQISSRKYPYVHFEQEREAGDIMLQVKNLSKTVNGEKVLDNITFELNKNDKVIFVGASDVAKQHYLKS